MVDKFLTLRSCLCQVNALQDAINEAKAKADDFNAREKVFGFPPTEYPILTQIESDLQVTHLEAGSSREFPAPSQPRSMSDTWCLRLSTCSPSTSCGT
jgi:hypothetical protein